jgi:hypothetical protein
MLLTEEIPIQIKYERGYIYPKVIREALDTWYKIFKMQWQFVGGLDIQTYLLHLHAPLNDKKTSIC